MARFVVFLIAALSISGCVTGGNSVNGNGGSASSSVSVDGNTANF